MTTTCPVCDRSFRDAHGRGGHLATYNDEAHDAFRLKHGLKHALGPDGQPTVVGARWRGPDTQFPAQEPLPPTPSPPVLKQETPLPPIPATLEAAAPATDVQPPSVPEARPEATVAAQPAPQVQPVTPAPAEAPPAVAPKPTSNGSVLIPLGIGIGSLAALVLANKGKNAPKPQPAPAQAPPPADAWPGIWARPEPIQSTGFPYVDRMLGYSGVPTMRRRG